jgi:hypothetical protein
VTGSDGHEDDRDAALLEHRSDERRAPSVQSLSPAQQDATGADLTGDRKDVLGRGPGPHLQADVQPVAVAPNELVRPGVDLVVRLVGERRQRVFLEDVQRDEVDASIGECLEE